MMLKTGDVAKQLRISENTVRDYVIRGGSACTITPTGDVFYEEDIEAFKKNYYRKETGGNEQ